MKQGKTKVMKLLVGMLPGYDGSPWQTYGNRHLLMLYNQMSGKGIKVRPLLKGELFNEKPSCDVDILHFHWMTAVFPFEDLHHFYSSINSSLSTNCGPFQKIIRHLQTNNSQRKKNILLRYSTEKIIEWIGELRTISKPIIWEIHDLASHHLKQDPLWSKIDYLCNWVLYNIADLIIMHEESCRMPILSNFGKTSDGRLRVVKIGPLDLEKEVPKYEARARLGIPQEKIVFSCIGTARPNRNPGNVVKAFSSWVENEILIVAGQGTKKYVIPNQSIKVFADWIEPTIMRDIYCASDFIILDGQDYLTSGVIRSAIHFKVPSICRLFGASKDMASGATVAIVGDDLKSAFEKARSIAGSAEYEEMIRCCKIRDDERNWVICSEMLYETYMTAAAIEESRLKRLNIEKDINELVNLL
jgi:hypothetical protein